VEREAWVIHRLSQIALNSVFSLLTVADDSEQRRLVTSSSAEFFFPFTYVTVGSRLEHLKQGFYCKCVCNDLLEIMEMEINSSTSRAYSIRRRLLIMRMLGDKKVGILGKHRRPY